MQKRHRLYPSVNVYSCNCYGPDQVYLIFLVDLEVWTSVTMMEKASVTQSIRETSSDRKFIGSNPLQECYT